MLLSKLAQHIPVNVTALQGDLLVDGVPQLGPERVEVLPHGREQAAVHCVRHLERNQSNYSASFPNLRPDSAVERHTDPVEAGLPAELVGPRRAEVVVGPEGLVERGDEVEKSLPATLVTQGVFSVLAALPQPEPDEQGLTKTALRGNSRLALGAGTHCEGLVALVD